MSTTTPFLVAQGRQDHTIPIALSRLLTQRANVQLVEIEPDHNRTPAVTATDAVWPAFEAFVVRPTPGKCTNCAC